MAKKEKPDADADVSKPNRLVCADVVVRGRVDIQFDRFISMDGEQHKPEEKMYLRSDGTMFLPSDNILSFFHGMRSPCCIKMFVESRKSKVIAQEAKALIGVSPAEVIFTRDGEPIKFKGFHNGEDKQADAYIHHATARVKDGIPNPMQRPTLRTPWELAFELSVYEMETRSITMDKVRGWLEQGGVLIGFGNHRPMFGRFEVVRFDLK